MWGGQNALALPEAGRRVGGHEGAKVLHELAHRLVHLAAAEHKRPGGLFASSSSTNRLRGMGARLLTVVAMVGHLKRAALSRVARPAAGLNYGFAISARKRTGLLVHADLPVATAVSRDPRLHA